jgi:nanoRNase/pAp phosphatase (c-di-AMP/oligoRNAs hydrolase)
MPGQSKANAFRSFVEQNKNFVVQPHDNPDPDAIAAAYGLTELIFALGGQAIICYAGRIPRALTQEMIGVLRIPIIPAVLPPGKNTSIIAVDGRIQNDNITKFPGRYVGEIDHHEAHREDAPVLYQDARPDYGSTSSIVGEYWRDLGLRIPHAVATALSIGINMDTQRFVRGANVADIEIFAWLFDKVDHAYMQYVLNNDLECADFQYYNRAFNSLVLRKNFGAADLGEIDNIPLLAAICDFLLSAKEIDVMLTFACSQDKLRLSLRSETSEYSAGEIARQITEGIGSGGGHPSMAAGACPLPKDGDIDALKGRIIERYFACIR